MNLLAFDLGGSGAKLLLGRYDGARIRLTELLRFPNRPTPINGGLYWNIVGIYGGLLSGLQKATALHSPIHSIGIDAFSNDFCLVDAAGELLTPARCYRDDRTVRYADYAYGRVSKRRLYELTGNQNARFNTLMQIAAMQAAGQGWLLDRADKLLFLPDLLVYFLTGEAVSEYTVASVSQLFSFSENNWCTELLRDFDLRRELFCRIAAPGTIVGTVSPAVLSSAGRAANLAADSGRNAMRVVSVCEHDTASAFLAAPIAPVAEDHAGAAILSSGTWSLLGCELLGPLICETGFLHNLANEGGCPGHHRFLRNVMGGWILQEIRSDYQSRGTDVSFAEIEDAARRAPAFLHPIDVDDDCFFEPGNMTEKIASWRKSRGGKAPEGLGELARCVYEGLALKYRAAVRLLERATGRPLPAIHIVGGGARDGLLCQLTASACNRPVTAGPYEATGLGNLIVQLIAAGELSSVEQGRELIRNSFELRRYEPQAAADWDGVGDPI
jgi:sugar (pentulose or hexulose) kinase